jgi:cytoskeleton protein RodZ
MTEHPIQQPDESPESPESPEALEPTGAGSGLRVEVRRNVGLSGAVAGFAGLLTVAFAARAFTGGTALDWLAFGVLALVTIAHAASIADGRAPLLVADDHGVRLRQGAQWRGIAWPDIDCLEHLPRRGLLRDGHLLVDGYDDQQLVVPLTLATRLVGAESGSLSDVLAELADGRADVTEVVPGLPDDSSASRSASVPKLSDLYAEDDAPVVPEERHGISARVAAGLAGRDAVADVEDTEDTEDTGEIALDAADIEDTGEIEAVEPERRTVLPARVAVEHQAIEHQAIEPEPPLPPAPADHAETMTVVLDDLAVRPAADPVIGPDLTAARDRLRLSIDQLSERTRIRPHVIEAIEVDDFAPCGGDFYARGHLRTLARVLGIDAGPLLASYDEHYAHAPVDPRRVFEAELATGAGGSIRSTRGGRNWSVLIAAVMGAVLIWSVAKLAMDGPEPVSSTPVLNQSGGVTSTPAKGDPVKLALTAAGGGAQLVIRDAAGAIVFDGNLAFGQSTELKVVPPVRIWSSDGSVTYGLAGKKPQALGETGTEVSKTLVAR